MHANQWKHWCAKDFNNSFIENQIQRTLKFLPKDVQIVATITKHILKHWSNIHVQWDLNLTNYQETEEMLRYIEGLLTRKPPFANFI